MKSKSLIILPASGYGTRMNLSPTDSKELISDPYNDNKPLIDWHLDNLKDYFKVIPTREEKSDLIDHLYKDPEANIYVQLVDTGKEWPSTILETELFWEEKNILILPDTRFEPKDIVSKIDEELNTHDFVFAVHEIPRIDKPKWGWVNLLANGPDSDGIYTPNYGTQEKPQLNELDLISLDYSTHAWGIIGFRNTCGKELFQAYLDKTYFDLTSYRTCVIFLESFKDICRTGKIEKY